MFNVSQLYATFSYIPTHIYIYRYEVYAEMTLASGNVEINVDGILPDNTR